MASKISRSGVNLTLGHLIVALVLFACFIDLHVVFGGLNGAVSPDSPPEGYKAFFQVLAWFPFPIYFALIYFVVRQSWDAFNDAWRTLPKTGVLMRADGKRIADEKEVLDRIIENFENWRKWLIIPLSLLAGAACMYMDSERERDTMMFAIWGYEQNGGKPLTDSYRVTKSTFSGQVARACEDPDFMSKWLWEELAKRQINATKICTLERDTKTEKPSSNTRRKNFNERMNHLKINIESSYRTDIEAKKRNKDFYVPPPLWQWLPVLLMHIEDMFIISFGWLVFLQCVAHSLFFWNFERMSAANFQGEKLCLKLNLASDLGEFGLEYWNHALNNLYWYFSVAIIIPILSRVSQRNLEDLDFSQLVLQFAIPVLVATPMVATILSRQSRLPACWEEIAKDDKDVQSYLQQRLWPLDKNWSSKLGILLAFVLLSISFGINLITLL